MKLLVLGGTGFPGPCSTAAAAIRNASTARHWPASSSGVATARTTWPRSKATAAGTRCSHVRVFPDDVARSAGLLAGRVDHYQIGRTRVDRAVAAGLVHRPIDDTVRDTLAWWRAQPAERRAAPKSGLTPQREADVLVVWHARSA